MHRKHAIIFGIGAVCIILPYLGTIDSHNGRSREICLDFEVRSFGSSLSFVLDQ